MSAKQELLLAEASRLYKTFCEQPERFSASSKNFAASVKHAKDAMSSRRRHAAAEDGDSSTLTYAHRLIQHDARALTLKDRVAAHTLVVNNNPKQSLHSLEELVRLVKGSSKRESVAALDALAGLWIDPLLPNDRKLSKLDTADHSAFTEQHATDPAKRVDKKSALLERKLVLKFYEHRLKELFVDYISVLEQYLQDPQVQLRKKAMSIVHQLLRNKPEQEQRLLALLVNKLGDPDRKLASNAMFYSNRLAAHHPLMAPFIVDEIGRFIFRPNLPLRAQYYALCFLNTLEIPENDEAAPAIEGKSSAATSMKMLQVYFTLFKSVYAKILEAEKLQQSGEQAVKKKKNKARTFRNRDANENSAENLTSEKNPDEEEKTEHAQELSKLFSALLSGVNRAFAAVPAEARESTIGQLAEQTDALFKLVHTCQSFPATMQILLLLQQLCMTNSAENEDEAEIVTVKIDQEADETTDKSSNIRLRDRFYATLYRKLAEPEILEHQSSRASKLLLNILYKSLRNDLASAVRVRATIKRTLQLALAAAPNFACALLVVVDEVLRNHPQRNVIMRTASKVSSLSAGELGRADLHAFDEDDEGEEEIYADEFEAVKSEPTEITEIGEEKQLKSSWIHSANQKKKSEEKKSKKPAENEKILVKLHAEISAYNFSARNPQFAGAEFETFWELAQLAQHAHPSVAIMAQKVLSGTSINYPGNPLDDFATIKFLDRFVNRNPKKKQQEKSSSNNRRADAKKVATQFLDQTSTQYARLPSNQVPPEEQFLHTFAQLRAIKRVDKPSKRGEDGDADEIESVADDEFDAYLERFERQQGDMYEKDAVDAEEDAEELEEIDFSEAMKQAGLETIDFNRGQNVAASDGDDDDDDENEVSAGTSAAENDDDDDEFPDIDSDDDDSDNDGGKRGNKKRKFDDSEFDLGEGFRKKRGRRGGGRRKRTH